MSATIYPSPPSRKQNRLSNTAIYLYELRLTQVVNATSLNNLKLAVHSTGPRESPRSAGLGVIRQRPRPWHTVGTWCCKCRPHCERLMLRARSAVRQTSAGLTLHVATTWSRNRCVHYWCMCSASNQANRKGVFHSDWNDFTETPLGYSLYGSRKTCGFGLGHTLDAQTTGKRVVKTDFNLSNHCMHKHSNFWIWIIMSMKYDLFDVCRLWIVVP